MLRAEVGRGRSPIVRWNVKGKGIMENASRRVSAFAQLEAYKSTITPVLTLVPVENFRIAAEQACSYSYRTICHGTSSSGRTTQTGNVGRNGVSPPIVLMEQYSVAAS